MDTVSAKMGILPPPAPAIVSPKTGTTVTTSSVWHVWSHNSAGFSSASAFAGLVVSLPPPSPAPTGMSPKHPDPGWASSERR
ncbi:MAG: hypothetical protein IT452_02965 [Planctomycetia bacterium]|nr:hypothetical protein [Planctomycetia bacterium]